MKFDFLENGKSFWSEIKIIFPSLISKVILFRLKKQTSKKVADTTFNYIIIKWIFLICCVDSSMLLFENCRELSFRVKAAICALQIMENSTSHPKSQIINYIIIWTFFEGLFADQNMLLCEDYREQRHVLQIGVLQITKHEMAK